MPIIFSLMLMKTLTKYIQFLKNSNLCLPQAITSRDGWEIKKIGGGKKTKQYLNQNEHGSVNYMKKRRIKKIIKNDYLRIKLNKSKFFKCWDFDVF